MLRSWILPQLAISCYKGSISSAVIAVFALYQQSSGRVLEELEPIDRNTTTRQDLSKAIVLADREEIYEVLPKLWHWGSRNGLEMGWLTIKQQVDWLKKARMCYERMQGESRQGVADMNTVIGVLGKFAEQP